MDRPVALVGWYYLPLAVVYGAAMISIATNVPLLAPVVILVMAITSSVLTRLYVGATGRRSSGFRDRRQRPWTIATLVAVLAGLVVCLAVHLHHAPYWSAWVAAAVVAIGMLGSGGAYESSLRQAPISSAADASVGSDHSAS